MIRKLVDVYIDSTYYIEHNQRKIAKDNFAVVYDMAGFLAFACLFFTVLTLAIPTDYSRYLCYLIPIAIIFLIMVTHRFLRDKVSESLLCTRIYCYLCYALIILGFSTADAFVYNDQRSLFFPAAILVLSAVFRDYIPIISIYKVVLIIAFACIDHKIKAPALVTKDIVSSIIVLVVSIFCYVSVMRANLISRKDNELLKEKSQTDLLTGSYNKLSFEEKCKELINERHPSAKVTLFMFDLDNFKEVNDRFGHQVGDEVIKNFSKIIKSYFHPTDIIGRIGGDEFMVLVMGEMGDNFITTRCRSIIHELNIIKIEEASGFSCSIGIVEDTQGHSFEELYNMADKALYQSKANGKGTFVIEKN